MAQSGRVTLLRSIKKTIALLIATEKRRGSSGKSGSAQVSKENAVAVILQGETRHIHIRHHEKDSQAVIYRNFTSGLIIYTLTSQSSSALCIVLSGVRRADVEKTVC